MPLPSAAWLPSAAICCRLLSAAAVRCRPLCRCRPLPSATVCCAAAVRCRLLPYAVLPSAAIHCAAAVRCAAASLCRLPRACRYAPMTLLLYRCAACLCCAAWQCCATCSRCSDIEGSELGFLWDMLTSSPTESENGAAEAPSHDLLPRQLLVEMHLPRSEPGQGEEETKATQRLATLAELAPLATLLHARGYRNVWHVGNGAFPTAELTLVRIGECDARVRGARAHAT